MQGWNKMETKRAALTEIDHGFRVSVRPLCAAAVPNDLFSCCPSRSLTAGPSITGASLWFWDASSVGKVVHILIFREQRPEFFLFSWTWYRPNEPFAIALLKPGRSALVYGRLRIRSDDPGPIFLGEAEDNPRGEE